MSAATVGPEDPRRIYGRTYAQHIYQWHEAQLREMGTSQLIASLYGKVMADDYVPTGPVVVIEPRFVRRVRQEHHEHGWQMIEVETDEANAEIVYTAAEVEAIPGTHRPDVLTEPWADARDRIQSEAWKLGHWTAGCNPTLCDHRDPYQNKVQR